MMLLRRPRVALAALAVVSMLAGLFGSAVVTLATQAPASAETTTPPVTVTAIVGATTYSVGQTISGLTDGTPIDIHVVATGTSPSLIYGIEGRQCEAGTSINNLFDYTPTQGGNCANVALGTGSLHPVVGVAPPYETGDMTFDAGVGTTTFLDEDDDSHTVTCNNSTECKLTVRLSVPPVSPFVSGDAYVSFPLSFGSAPTVPTAPLGVTGVAGNGQVAVSWSAPSSNGGATITGYTVTASPGGATCAWTTGPLTCTVTGLANGTPYTFTVTATNSAGTGPASTASSPVTPVSSGSYFHALTPARVLDSRPATQVGPYNSPWGPGVTRDVSIGGQGGVPADASAVVLNVTVADTTASSFLTVWPKGGSKPTASSLNWTAGEVIPNAVTVELGTSGDVSVFNPGGNVDVIIDVAGYYDSVSGGDGFTSLAPVRVLDSRSATQVGPYNTPWGAGATRNVTVGGTDGVPAGADAVVLNVTVADTTGSGFLTVWPAGATKPTASSLNWTPGEVIPNAVTVKLGTSGAISVFNPAGSTDVIIDIAGYYQNGTGKLFHPLAPARVLDSRSATQVGAYNTPWGPGITRTIAIGGLAGVPGGADSVVLNVTVADTTASSFLTVWPTGGTKPTASSLNWVAGEVIPNAVTVKLGTTGDVSAFNPGGNVDVIVDVAGYFS